MTLLRSHPRSEEALTPLHVAAAWGCRRGLELLLSQGADPELRDQVGELLREDEVDPEGEERGKVRGRPLLTALPQDGLRPLDLAVRQGHPDCARILCELDSRTTARAEAQDPESEPEPGSESGLRGRLVPPVSLASSLPFSASPAICGGPRHHCHLLARLSRPLPSQLPLLPTSLLLQTLASSCLI